MGKSVVAAVARRVCWRRPGEGLRAGGSEPCVGPRHVRVDDVTSAY